MRRALAVLAVLAVAAPAAAAPIRVVVRHAGGDDLVLQRLAGQIVDLDVEAVPTSGALEPSLDAQIDEATALARENDAAAVVWFRAADRGLIVVVATPHDRRVLVRAIDAGDDSATAEAAAQAARSALRAISLGGTIGVAVPAAAEPTRTRWSGAAGWQVAADGGADLGAHAIWQRLDLVRGRWGGSLALSLGPPLRKAGDVDVDLSRSSVLVAAEHLRGPWRFALGAGVALYHRATVNVPAGLHPTDSQLQAAFDVAPEVRFRLGLGRSWGLEVGAGVDIVIGAPTLAIDRGGGMVETLAKIATLQPRVALGLLVGGR